MGSSAVERDSKGKANGWIKVSWRDSTLAAVIIAFDEIGSIFHHVASHPWHRYGELYYRLCVTLGLVVPKIRSGRLQPPRSGTWSKLSYRGRSLAVLGSVC